jgi:hypothetical protein
LQDAISRFHSDDGLNRDAGRRSMELRRLLRSFLDVCNAIGYAHDRGVLHRDIKHGETLVVDWGLAKATGRPNPTADEQPLWPDSAIGGDTMPGWLLGTPAYLSPEQAGGDLDALGPHSDVYSLGATLYCLLTGKAPFDAKAGDVFRRVQAGDFPPPRRVAPSIDPALEALCLKAMAARPEDRYATCRALADDVERWMADEPVSPYPEPLAKRARRWAKRNRTAVTGAAVALLAGMVGLSAVLAIQTKANAELSRSKAAEGDREDMRCKRRGRRRTVHGDRFSAGGILAFDVTEPAPDHVDLDPGLEHVHRDRMTDRVWRHLPASQAGRGHAGPARVAALDLGDP